MAGDDPMRNKRYCNLIKDILFILAAFTLAAILLFASQAEAEFDGTTVGTGSSLLYQGNTMDAGSVTENDDSAAEDTDAIKQWTDGSGNGNHVTQTDDTGARLVYDTTGIDSAYPCLQGGSGDFMEFTNRALIKNQAGVTILWLAQYVDSGTFQGVLGLFAGDSSFNIRLSAVIDSSDQPYQQLRNPDSTSNDWFTNDALTNGAVHVVVWRSDLAGSEGSLWIDEVEVDTDALSGTSNFSNTDSDADLTVFGTEGYTNTNRSCTGALYIWGEALSDADIVEASQGVLADFSPAPPASNLSLRMLMGMGQ
jgi:hypothetical protein